MSAEQWADALPEELAAHRAVLRRLVAAVQREPAVRWLELACSIAEDRGDALSDLDMGMGIDEAVWPDALTEIPALVAQAGDVIDMLQHQIPEWGNRAHQRVFVQYASGVQLDLVCLPAHGMGGKALPAVVLHDPDALRAMAWDPSLLAAGPEQAREWAFLGWVALADMTKYLRRGSLWEALERLQQARSHVWQLWALQHGVAAPVFGMTTVLDRPEIGTPPTIEETVATLAEADLWRAARACAALLAGTSRAVAGACEPLAAYVMGLLPPTASDAG